MFHNTHVGASAILARVLLISDHDKYIRECKGGLTNRPHPTLGPQHHQDVEHDPPCRQLRGQQNCGRKSEVHSAPDQ